MDFELEITESQDFPVFYDFETDCESPQPIQPNNSEEKELEEQELEEPKMQKQKKSIFDRFNIFSRIFNHNQISDKKLSNYDDTYKEKCISLFCQNRLKNIEEYYNVMQKIIFSKCNEIYNELIYLKPVEINDYKSKVSLSVQFCDTIQETLEVNDYTEQFKKLNSEVKQYVLYDDEINDIANVLIDEIKQYGYNSTFSSKEKCFYIYYKYHNIEEEIKKNISKNINNFRKRKREE